MVLFVGPSGWGIDARLFDGVERLPPAQRGDVDRLIEGAGRPGVLILCDGVFRSAPAVSHAEICRALDRGWQVHGVASIGAIRAFEMAAEGMRGHGWVHAQFSRHEDFTDDELCLLHVPEPPFEPLSEALVNVRYGFEVEGARLGVSHEAQRIVTSTLAALWFGDRSFARVREAMVHDAGIGAEAADRLMAWTATHRIKSLDLAALLTQRPWRARRRG